MFGVLKSANLNFRGHVLEVIPERQVVLDAFQGCQMSQHEISGGLLSLQLLERRGNI